jgi:septum formation inhibitor-activating ATPase MinD
MAQSMKPHVALVVTTPQEMSLIDSRRAINMAKTLKIERIGVVENMSELSCPHCGVSIDVFGSGGGMRISEELDVDLLGCVPVDLKARAGADEGRPIVLEDETSRMSAALFRVAEGVERLVGEPAGAVAVPHG